MCEKQDSTVISVSGYTTTGGIFVWYPPPCYEPLDPCEKPCEKCSFKNNCTKKNKPVVPCYPTYPYPYTWPWWEPSLI